LNKINNIYFFSLLFLFDCSDIFDDEAVYGCTDKNACNYNESATKLWEGSCEYAVGTCDCDGLPINQTCDCDGSIDSDYDGLCDNIDICIGEYDNAYYCSDLHIFDDFINLNPGSALDSISVSELIDENNLYCTFDDDGRLRTLRLDSLSIYIVPNSMSSLDSLETIWLNNNNITALNPSICNLSILSDFYISDNQLCDQYKFDCINWDPNSNHWEPQECNE
jgi:Leucine-rich repeat (LRR) protein